MSSLVYAVHQPGHRRSPVTIMQSPSEVLHLSEEEFNSHLKKMEEKDILITVSFLQKEMSLEQDRFNDLRKQFEEIEDSESPETDILATKLLTSQSRLTELMSRTQKCFLQRNQLDNKNGENSDSSDFQSASPEPPPPVGFQDNSDYSENHSNHNGTNGLANLDVSPTLREDTIVEEVEHTSPDSYLPENHSKSTSHSSSILADRKTLPFAEYAVTDATSLVRDQPVLDVPDVSLNNNNTEKPNGTSSDFHLIEYDHSPQFPRAKSPPVRTEDMDKKHETLSTGTMPSSKSPTSDEHITVSRFVSETTFTVRNIRQELNKSDSNPELYKPESKVVILSGSKSSQERSKPNGKDPEISKSGAISEIDSMVKDLEASRLDTSSVIKAPPKSGKYVHSSSISQSRSAGDSVELPKVSQLMQNFEKNSGASTVSNGTVRASSDSVEMRQPKQSGLAPHSNAKSRNSTANERPKSGGKNFKNRPTSDTTDIRSQLMEEIRKSKSSIKPLSTEAAAPQKEETIISSSKEGSRVSWADKGTAAKSINSTQIVGNGQDAKWGSNSGFISPVPPALESTEGFSADDKIKSRTTLRDWDPVKLLRDLYEVRLMPDNQANYQSYINAEGYMEKLPLNKKKATLLKTWKRRYFRAKEGCLFYYEDHFSQTPDQEEYETLDNTTERSSGVVQLGGGNVEALEDRIIGIDDGRGHYLTLRCTSDDDMDRWMRALKSQTVEDVAPTWIQPVLHAPPSSKRKVVIVDIGSCSVRAGILGDEPSLPQLFFPSIIATNKSGQRIFGFDALKPEIRSSHPLSYLVRPAFRLDKTTFDMEAMEPLFTKIFADLKVDPSEHWLMFSSPGNFSDIVKQQFMELFINRFKLRGVNIVSQTLLSLYSYQTSTGVFVNIGECLEIVPVTDGYVVDGGVTRQPYGGHRVAEFLNSSFTESRYRFFTDVEFQIVRLAVERSCYVALDFKEEQRKCMIDPTPFRKTINLDAYDLPPGTWQNVTHDLSRFKSCEGLFDTSLWEMDNPPLPKLVQKAVIASPMDTRREMWRNICLSGGVTQMPGFAERLKAELSKLVPSSVRVQIRASPHRYHSAFIGACTMASFNTWEQSGISADEWKKHGVNSLKKWHIN